MSRLKFMFISFILSMSSIVFLGYFFWEPVINGYYFVVYGKRSIAELPYSRDDFSIIIYLMGKHNIGIDLRAKEMKRTLIEILRTSRYVDMMHPKKKRCINFVGEDDLFYEIELHGNYIVYNSCKYENEYLLEFIKELHLLFDFEYSKSMENCQYKTKDCGELIFSLPPTSKMSLSENIVYCKNEQMIYIANM